MRKITALESKGKITILLDLLEGEKNISQLITQDRGQAAVYRTRYTLDLLGLTKERVGTHNARFLALTEKGEQIAKHLQAIEKLLEE